MSCLRGLSGSESSFKAVQLIEHSYFTFYHRFLPVLDPTKTPQAYYEASPLLFWSIISVAARRMHENPTLLIGLATTVTDLVWKSLQAVPHSKSVVQSLLLLCTWPFPTSSSTSDVTYMWAGMIMQISIQMGLHRPMNAQDFTKFRIRLTDQDVVERITTWAACNIVVLRYVVPARNCKQGCF